MELVLKLLLIPYLVLGLGVGTLLFEGGSAEDFLWIFGSLAVFGGLAYVLGRKVSDPVWRWSPLAAVLAGILGGAAIHVFGAAKVRTAAETVRKASGH